MIFYMAKKRRKNRPHFTETLITKGTISCAFSLISSNDAEPSVLTVLQ